MAKDVFDRLDLAQETSRWRKALANPDARAPVWIACREAEVLGFLAAGQNRYPEVPCDAELHALYIHPSAQRQGVGKAMLSVAVDWLLSQNYESMAVFAFRDNVQGTGFYRALGAELYDSGEYEVAGVKYPDQSFRWRSLAALARRLAVNSER